MMLTTIALLNFLVQSSERSFSRGRSVCADVSGLSQVVFRIMDQEVCVIDQEVCVVDQEVCVVDRTRVCLNIH